MLIPIINKNKEIEIKAKIRSIYGFKKQRRVRRDKKEIFRTL